MNQTYSYRPASGLVLTITLLMVAQGGLAAVGAWSTWLEIQLLETVPAFGNVDPEKWEANDARQTMVGDVQMGLSLTLAVLFLLWVHRANKNARALGAEGMLFTPGWCVGWFFVPFANLIKPPQALKEIWKASHPTFGEDWRQVRGSWLFGFWWTLCIVTTVLRYIAYRLTGKAERIPELLDADWISLISELMEVPLVILTLSVVRSIHALQERKSELLLDLPGQDRHFGLPASDTQ
jgi:hypothetical protein